jgi:hypothetical protein
MCGCQEPIKGILNRIQGLLQPVDAAQDDWEEDPLPDRAAFDSICPPKDRIEELCLQKDMEAHWENLVRTMAPNCVGINRVFGIDRADKETGFIPPGHPSNEGVIRCLINEAILNVQAPINEEPKCVPFEPNVPDTIAFSVQDISRNCFRGRTLLTGGAALQPQSPPTLSTPSGPATDTQAMSTSEAASTSEQIPAKPGRSPGRRR